MTETSGKDFIKDYSAYILEKFPTNPDWAELCALTTLATAVGSKVELHTKSGPMPLNLFGFNVGVSRLTYKSTPLKYVIIPTLHQLTEQVGKDLITPSRYSTEGLIEYFHDISNEGCIIRDEFTGQFKDISNKKYMSEGMEFLSELYDGIITPRYTKSTGHERLIYVYINYLTATTPYIFLIKGLKQWFHQGTGNRFVIVYSKPDKEKIDDQRFDTYALPVIEGDGMMPPDEINEFAKRLYQIRENCPPRVVISLGGAQVIMNSYLYRYSDMSFVTYANDLFDTRYSYYFNTHEFMSRFAALKCISRNEEMMDSFNEAQLIASETDVRWAEMKIDRHVAYFNEMMTDWEKMSTRKEEPMPSYKLHNEAILQEVKDNEGAVTLNRLCEMLETHKAAIGPFLNQLLEPKDDITKQLFHREGKEKKGRGAKPDVYYLDGYKDTIPKEITKSNKKYLAERRKKKKNRKQT